MSAFLRKYATGTGADICVPIIKRASVDFAVSADWTPAAGDVKISIDGGAAANIGTLPVSVTMGNTAYWKFVFSNGELTGKTMIITVADSAAKAVEDQAFIIETYGNASAMYQADLSAANLPANLKQISDDSTAADNAESFFDGSGYAGTNNIIPVVTTLTGHTPQTGDSFARIGTNGAGLTAIGDTRLANLDATTSSRLASASYTAPDNAGISSAASSASTAATQATTAATQSTTAATNSTTILNRIGAFTGSGINTILGFFRALLRKDAALTPTDVGGTFDNTTDSTEAIRDAGSGGGLTGDQDAALTRIDRTVKGIASKRD